MNNNIKRVFLTVLDSLGAGEAPDAEKFGDLGASTLRALASSDKLNIPNLLNMGLGNIDGLSFLGCADKPSSAYARMTESSQGKDTTIGHWEIAGHISSSPLPTFPEGFPDEILDKLSNLTSRKIICNRPYSGTKVIQDYGDEHISTGALIVYTSADSVFQIAAHENIIPIEELYSICRTARKLLSGRFGVGRVIARPFAGDTPNFYRTDNRRDFSIIPPAGLLPETVKEASLDSISIGKIGDIFANIGFTESFPTHSNTEGMEVLEKMLSHDFCGLCFANLVDFDMKYGHRRDIDGYASALSAFDTFIESFCNKMKTSDLLIITADHGCDPSFTKTTDHTREYTPLLIYSPLLVPENFGTRYSFADISATISNLLKTPKTNCGIPLKLKFR